MAYDDVLERTHRLKLAKTFCVLVSGVRPPLMRIDAVHDNFCPSLTSRGGKSESPLRRKKTGQHLPYLTNKIQRPHELGKDAASIIDGVATLAEPDPELEPGQRMADGVNGTGRCAFPELSLEQIQRHVRVNGLVKSPFASQERHMRM